MSTSYQEITEHKHPLKNISRNTSRWNDSQ